MRIIIDKGVWQRPWAFATCHNRFVLLSARDNSAAARRPWGLSACLIAMAVVARCVCVCLSVPEVSYLTSLSPSAAEEPKSPAIAVTSTKAKEFLASLRRAKRNIWDRSRPDVQQWIQQFFYLGYDEAVSIASLSQWLNANVPPNPKPRTLVRPNCYE